MVDDKYKKLVLFMYPDASLLNNFDTYQIIATKNGNHLRISTIRESGELAWKSAAVAVADEIHNKYKQRYKGNPNQHINNAIALQEKIQNRQTELQLAHDRCQAEIEQAEIDIIQLKRLIKHNLDRISKIRQRAKEQNCLDIL